VRNPKQYAFLRAYAKTGNIQLAAKAAKVGRRTHYDWLTNASYAEDFRDAQAEALEMLEAAAHKRATRARKPSDILLMFLLKKLDPSYRENHRVEHTGPGGSALSIKVEFVKPE
jgi:hypothetical protein